MIPIRRYDPTKDGLARWFGCLEAVTMEILWAAERPMTIKRICQAMHERDYTRSLSAIGVTLQRLQRADLVIRRNTWPSGWCARWDRAAWEQAQIEAIRASL